MFNHQKQHEFTFGMKVTYKGIENGMVKHTSDVNKNMIFVVFHCSGNWDRFQDYRAANVRAKDLKKGWV